MKIQEALDRYLVQPRADGRSEHTQSQYRGHVTLLGAWLRNSSRPDSLCNSIQDAIRAHPENVVSPWLDAHALDRGQSSLTPLPRSTIRTS